MVVAASEPLTPLDEQAVRELLAGVELELGDERAKTASALEQARTNQQLAITLSILSFAAGCAITSAIVYGTKP